MNCIIVDDEETARLIIEKLASKINVPIENLVQTINSYNSSCDSGIDKEIGRERMFGKIDEPPFYAIHAGGITVVSPAGLKTNDSLNVLRTDGSIIPNLYAAGEVLGFTRLSGSAFVNGMSLMPALTFGKLLGEKILHWNRSLRIALAVCTLKGNFENEI